LKKLLNLQKTQNLALPNALTNPHCKERAYNLVSERAKRASLDEDKNTNKLTN